VWDANGLAQFGYDAVTRPHRIEDWRALIHPEDVAAVKHASDDAIQGTGERIDCEFRVRRRDGTYAHVRARSFIVREADGTPLRVIGSLSDISERHEIEQMSATLAHAARLLKVALHIDLADLRGYHYQNGTIFSVFTAGEPTALGNGGRYDGIGKAFGRARPATGFTLDLRQLTSVLAKSTPPPPPPR
jgi:hypothetical protein